MSSIDVDRVVVRFAPSPTGSLHIGSARIALFNWLYAKKVKGKFLLRIEDTDRARSTKEATNTIFSSLRWLGIDWDDEVIFQSERYKRHNDVAHEMVKNGGAYYCYATPEEIQQHKEKNIKFQSPWRDPNHPIPQDIKPVIRLKANNNGISIVEDIVYGTVNVNNTELDDMILLRSDGSPTYMLAVVVDDHDMGVNYVIRGDDHFTNTFRQNQIYEAMQWVKPEYAHIPLIHGQTGGKLSKRHNAVGVESYKEMGFLPEAMCSYLLRLGWSYGNEDIMTVEHAQQIFDIHHINRAPAKFDINKLRSVNAYFIRNYKDDLLIALIIKDLNLNGEQIERLKLALPLFRERAYTIPDLTAMTKLLIEPNYPPDEQSLKVLGNNKFSKAMINQISDWHNSQEVQDNLKAIAHQENIKITELMQFLRAVILGTFDSPNLVGMMFALGKQECISRIEVYYNHQQENS